MTDAIGVAVGFVLTLMVISYLFGDNPLFRLAVHIFIGVAAGYTTIMVVDQLILQQTIFPLISAPLQNLHLALPPLLLGAWLLVKASPRLERLGNPVMAILVGVGAATAIGGAVLGTLFPQVNAAMGALDLQAAQQSSNSGFGLVIWVVSAVIMLLATVVTLAYFQFGLPGRPEQPGTLQVILTPVRYIGQAILAVTFGVLFSGVYLAALTALVGRVYFVWATIWGWLSMFITVQ